MAWIRACGGGSPAVPDGKTVTPINDVTIWQKCAGIANPTYTTLSDVLADTGVLSTLIASDNAVDYLVRSTTFASDVCSNANAMTYIGQNNYASNTLLADSDWLDGICNSTYFESVLNVKVPTMTSDNTPSGVCSSSGVWSTGTHPYQTFDNNNSTRVDLANPTANSYVAYDFNKNVRVYKVHYYTTDNPPYTAKVQYYDTSSSAWIDATDTLSVASSNTGVNKTFLVSNVAEASKWAWRNVTVTNNEVCRAYTLQFYGREDV